MGDLKNRKDSPDFWLSFFLLLGAAAGAVFCNGMGNVWKEELTAAGSSMVTAAALFKADFLELFRMVLEKRLGELFLLLLFSMTRISGILFMAVSAYIGFSSAVMVCALTMKAGLPGLFRYLVLMFPQAAFYMTVFYVIAWWMGRERKQATAAAALALGLATALGAAAESFANPWITAWLL